MRHVLIVVIGLAVCSAGWADSLFTPTVAKAGTLISDKQKRFEVGEIITVMVRERIDASTESNTNTKKESEVSSEADPDDNQFLIAPKPNGLGLLNAAELPNWGIEVENELRTRGQTSRKNTLTTTVSCVVTKVFENGNVAIEGSKQVAVNREFSKLHVSGIIRSRDVTPGNVIQSSQIASAQILLKGQGPLWNNQRRGLFTKLIDWFSPF